MSETETGRATGIPPRDVWLSGDRGLSRWRPHVSEVTVEPWGESGEGKILSIRETGLPAVTIKLSRDEAEHLARLLLPSAPASEAAA